MGEMTRFPVFHRIALDGYMSGQHRQVPQLTNESSDIDATLGRQVRAIEPAGLFVAKRHDRIDKRRTASGDVARQQRDQNEQGSNRNER